MPLKTAPGMARGSLPRPEQGLMRGSGEGDRLAMGICQKKNGHGSKARTPGGHPKLGIAPRCHLQVRESQRQMQPPRK